ncbi:ribonuclease H-like protein [Westerdykella ornata]|uniref:Ribonuclease H-like protein n=1 Tax=Westerdykella ornata TaxID=318751 RepID=A0A6A6JST7_WESOR|nr:ribonuclease H-like protein [Westerdykella ornata]KAF2279670.1 ribonuclease H-like protein [Westerdykella ornata]
MPLVKSTLHRLLTRIGSSTTGLKTELVARLDRDVRVSRYPSVPRERRSQGTKTKGELVRILSIDMGIRNLAFCVVDGELDGAEEREVQMEIVAWRRLDVLDEVERLIPSPSPLPSSPLPNTDLEPDNHPKNSYNPSTLSQTAYSLLKHTLLPYNPDIILIERQRWRTNSSPAIQQWTLRVNTLEAMLWAMLTALKGEAAAVSAQGMQIPSSTTGEDSNQSAALSASASRLNYDYTVYPVDPKRVANFWLGPLTTKIPSPSRKKDKKKQPPTPSPEEESHNLPTIDPPPTKTPLPRGKAEKKFKIQLLRTWLDQSSSGTGSETTRDEETATDVENGGKGRRKGKKKTMMKEEGEEEVKDASGLGIEGKLDDVTDCFLQAAAWVAWEANRVRILEGRDELVKGILDGEHGRRGKGDGEAKEKKKKAKKDVKKSEGGGREGGDQEGSDPVGEVMKGRRSRGARKGKGGAG